MEDYGVKAVQFPTPEEINRMRINGYQSAIRDLTEKLEKAKKIIESLGGYMMTVRKRDNTDEWMEELRSRISEADIFLEALSQLEPRK